MNTTYERKEEQADDLVHTRSTSPGTGKSSSLPAEKRTLAELQRQMDETLASNDFLPLMGALQDYIETERRQNTRRLTVLSVTFLITLVVFLIGPYWLGKHFLARTEAQLTAERQSLQQFGDSVESGLRTLNETTAELRQTLETQREALQALREDLISSRIKLDLPAMPDVLGGVTTSAVLPGLTVGIGEATGRVESIAAPVMAAPTPTPNTIMAVVPAPTAVPVTVVPTVVPVVIPTPTTAIAPTGTVAAIPQTNNTAQARERLLKIVDEIDAALAAIHRDAATVAPGTSNRTEVLRTPSP